jgi:hypothetical protein
LLAPCFSPVVAAVAGPLQAVFGLEVLVLHHP